MFLKKKTYKSTNNYLDNLNLLKEKVENSDYVLIGAGSGLSTAAGFTYSGERLEKYFPDFVEKYGFEDMYSAGFYPYSSLEEHWGYWARYIYINRYMDAPKDTYENLLKLVDGKNYFVLTTNVDHCFQKAGFDKNRMYYMQGDYGLFQCSDPCHQITYDNKQMIVDMLVSSGFLDENGQITDPENWKMKIDSNCIPVCPHCGKPLTMNLRSDDSFVQDDGWYAAKNRYDNFVEESLGKNVLYLELGVGMNTPVWIKYPFWKMTYSNKKATYACLNYGQAYAPREIEKQSICIDGDIDDMLEKII